MPRSGKAEAKEAAFLQNFAKVSQNANMERILKVCKRNREVTTALAQLANSKAFKASVSGTAEGDDSAEKLIPSSKTYLGNVAKDFYRWALPGIHLCFRSEYWCTTLKEKSNAMQVFMYLTGEHKKSKVFARSGFTFVAGYKGLIVKDKATRLNHMVSCSEAAPLNWGTMGVYTIDREAKKLRHASSGKARRVPHNTLLSHSSPCLGKLFQATAFVAQRILESEP